jgi:hypothetical protein
MEAFIRTVISVSVGVVGYWFPLWWDRKYAEPDSRIGMLFLWSLPIILIYAVLATGSLVRAYHYAPSSRRLPRVVLLVALVGLCWSPVAIAAFGILKR